MHYVLTWTGGGGEPMAAGFPSAEATLRHARAIGAPAVGVSILAAGQTLTFDELWRIVVVSRRA